MQHAVATRVQGCKILLLGDSRAFFVVYRLITDAGLRAYQLDRDGALARGGRQARASAGGRCAVMCLGSGHTIRRFSRRLSAHALSAASATLTPVAGFLSICAVTSMSASRSAGSG